MESPETHILLVDDEEPNRVLLAKRLTNDCHHVTAVEGGPCALEALRSTPVDLVLLDLMMPGMSGIETLDAIKADPTYDNLPVIMLTASNTRDSVVHCLSLGAADYIIKPVDPAELRRRIQKHVTPRKSPSD